MVALKYQQTILGFIMLAVHVLYITGGSAAPVVIMDYPRGPNVIIRRAKCLVHGPQFDTHVIDDA